MRQITDIDLYRAAQLEASTGPMTKRKFDALNKWNHGCPMPSDTRESYRDSMHRTGDYVWCADTGKWRWRPDQLARKARLGPGALLRPSPLRTALAWRLLGRFIYAGCHGRVAASD